MPACVFYSSGVLPGQEHGGGQRVRGNQEFVRIEYEDAREGHGDGRSRRRSDIMIGYSI